MDPTSATPGPTRREPLVELKGVDKHFGDLHVLRDINLTVGRGEVVRNPHRLPPCRDARTPPRRVPDEALTGERLRRSRRACTGKPHETDARAGARP